MEQINQLYLEMIRYEQGCPARIQHFTKVFAFAKLIGESERLDADTQFLLESAALVHDIGIRMAEEKYKTCTGTLQEQLGPAIAKEMRVRLNFKEAEIERICFLVGHHHTYDHVQGLDYQILLEADFLVNLYEGQQDQSAARRAYQQIFRTETGKKICEQMFL